MKKKLAIILTIALLTIPFKVKAQEPCINCHGDGASADDLNKSGYTKLKAGAPVTKDTLDALNPLVQYSDSADELSTPGGVLSRLLTRFAFPIAGLILFVMLVWGGFEMLSGAATQKSVDAGKQRVTAALIGFMLLFASYWIAQILEAMFGIKILF